MSRGRVCKGCLTSIAVLAFASWAWGANLLENGSFEQSVEGRLTESWNRMGNYLPEAGRAWALDTSMAQHGKTSIRADAPGRYAIGTEVPRSGGYVFSIYLRAAAPAKKAKLVFGRYERWKYIEKSTDVTVGKEWTRHSIYQSAVGPVVLGVESVGRGALWADAAQLEAGSKPTAFVGQRYAPPLPEKETRRQRVEPSNSLVMYVDADHDHTSFHRISVNDTGRVSGVFYRRKADRTSWRFTGKSVARRTPAGWSFEMAVSFADLGLSARPSEAPIGINIDSMYNASDGTVKHTDWIGLTSNVLSPPKYGHLWLDRVRPIEDRVFGNVVAARVERAPKVDGRLDEADWRKAQPAGNFKRPMDKLTSDRPKFRVLYDEKNLYLGFEYDVSEQVFFVSDLDWGRQQLGPNTLSMILANVSPRPQTARVVLTVTPEKEKQGERSTIRLRIPAGGEAPCEIKYQLAAVGRNRADLDIFVGNANKANFVEKRILYAFARDYSKKPTHKIPRSVPQGELALSGFGGAAPPGEAVRVAGGVPFPKGALFDPRNIELLDTRGNTVGCQADVLARWVPDGSIKWLMVETQADIAPKQSPQYMFRYGGPARNKTKTGLTVKRTEKSVEVTTGPLRFLVKDPDTGFPGPVWFDANGDGTFSDDEMVVSGQAPIAPVASNAAGEVFLPKMDDGTSVTVEREGPYCVILRAQGQHVSKSGQKLLSYVARIHAFAGKPEIGISYTYVNDSRPHATLLGSLYQWVPLKPRRIARFIFGTDKEPIEGALDDNQWGALLQVAKSKKPLFDAVQFAPDKESDFANGRTLGRGAKAAGWAHVEGEKAGVTVFLKDFWQNHPKELMVSSCPHHAAQIGIGLWPRSRVKAVDLSRGIARTHDVVLRFDKPGRPMTEVAKAAETLGHHLLLVAEPSWYSKTLVFGHTAMPDPERFPIFAKRIAPGKGSSLGSHSRESKDRLGLYGEFDYGDAPGDGGWGNLESFLDHVFFMRFLQSMDAEALEAAEAAARHYRDVDVAHPDGVVHSHCSNHTFSGGVPSHTWIQGVRDHYVLFGDMRSKEVLAEAGRWLASYPPGSLTGRSLSLPLEDMIDIYRITGQQEVLDWLVAQIKVLGSRQRPDEGLSGAETGSWFEHRYTCGSAFVWYGCVALVKLHRMVGGDDIRQIFLDELDPSINVPLKGKTATFQIPGKIDIDITADELGRFAIGRGSTLFEPMGYAYELTRDRKYIDLGMRALAANLLKVGGGASQSQAVLCTPFLAVAARAGVTAADEARYFNRAVENILRRLPDTLQDPSFENPRAKVWSLPAGSTFDDKAKVHGRYSLRISSDKGTSRLNAFQFIRIKPKTNYALTCYMRKTKGAVPTFLASISDPVTGEGHTYYGGHGRQTDGNWVKWRETFGTESEQVAGKNGLATDKWLKLGCTFNSANCIRAVIRVYNNKGIGSCWYDAIHLQQIK